MEGAAADPTEVEHLSFPALSVRMEAPCSGLGRRVPGHPGEPISQVSRPNLAVGRDVVEPISPERERLAGLRTSAALDSDRASYRNRVGCGSIHLC